MTVHKFRIREPRAVKELLAWHTPAWVHVGGQEYALETMSIRHETVDGQRRIYVDLNVSDHFRRSSVSRPAVWAGVGSPRLHLSWCGASLSVKVG